MLLSEPYWLPGMSIPFGPCIHSAVVTIAISKKILFGTLQLWFNQTLGAEV